MHGFTVGVILSDIPCSFSNTFHVLRPAKSPGFSYAWLEFISHRVFIGRMLAITPQQKVSEVRHHVDLSLKFYC